MKEEKVMKAVILCGGMGTRLREETEYRPKPMVDIGGKPILWHIMKIYSHYGFNEFILCLGYKAEIIKEYFLNYDMMNSDFTLEIGREKGIQFHNTLSEHKWKVTLVDTGEKTMTGARVKRIQRYIDTDSFFLTYGDGVADVNIGELLNFHKNHGKIATVTGVNPVSRYGELIVEGNRVTYFGEKPQLKESWINGGFFVFNQKIFDYLDDDESCVLEKIPLENLAKEGQLSMYKHAGYWQCMDTYRDREMLNKEWESGNPPWKVWDR